MKRSNVLWSMILAGVLLLAAGCGGQANETETPQPAATDAQATTVEQQTLTVMTHDSFSVSQEVVAAFEQEHHAKVVFLKSGDTGSALNRAVLSKANPLADVFYGVDYTFLSRALDEDIFEPYQSPLLENIPDEFELDSQFRALPVDYGDVCINYDKSYFEQNNLAVPQSLEDLAKPEYNGLLVMENPAISSTGLAFLLATITHFGEDGYLEYWQSLQDNGVVIVSDWETAYYTNFSASSGKGPQPMVVSYGSSPAVEVIYAETELTEAPTASIVGPDTCFRQIEFVGILKGTRNRDLAEAFVDFMLDRTFQADMPTQMFVFPVNEQVELPEVFVENIQIPEQPATMEYTSIAEKREQWINDWTDLMLR